MSNKAVTLRDFVNRIQDDARIFLVEYERAIAKHPQMFKGTAPRSYWMRIFFQFMRGDSNSIELIVAPQNDAEEAFEEPPTQKRKP